jgi:hypothetical protein
MIVLSGYNTTPYEQLYGIKHPDWLDNLHTFGELPLSMMEPTFKENYVIKA